MSELSRHRWKPAALAGDLARGVAALSVSLFFLILVPVYSVAFFVLLVLAVLFGLYLAGTVSQWSSTVEVDDAGLNVRGGFLGARTIKWTELTRFELRHFPLSRDRTQGWMELQLKTATASVSIDDRLDGFDVVLRRAWVAARAAEVGVSNATHANLIAVGVVQGARA